MDNDDKAFASEAAPAGYNLRPDGAYVSVDTATDSRYQFGGSASFSLEAWINPQERTESYKAGILGNFVMNLCGCWNIGYGIFISYPATTVKFVRSANTNGGTIDTLESASITPNEWTHIVATFDGTTMKIFVNGQLSASKPAANTVTLTAPWYVLVSSTSTTALPTIQAFSSVQSMKRPFTTTPCH